MLQRVSTACKLCCFSVGHTRVAYLIIKFIHTVLFSASAFLFSDTKRYDLLFLLFTILLKVTEHLTSFHNETLFSYFLAIRCIYRSCQNMTDMQ